MIYNILFKSKYKYNKCTIKKCTYYLYSKYITKTLGSYISEYFFNLFTFFKLPSTLNPLMDLYEIC